MKTIKEKLLEEYDKKFYKPVIQQRGFLLKALNRMERAMEKEKTKLVDKFANKLTKKS